MNIDELRQEVDELENKFKEKQERDALNKRKKELQYALENRCMYCNSIRVLDFCGVQCNCDENRD